MKKKSLFLFLACLILLVAACTDNDAEHSNSADDLPSDDDDNDDNNDNNGDDDDTTDDDDNNDDNNDDTADDDDDDDDNDDDNDTTPDPLGDNDQDGMTNGQELLDGTDPEDPGDALMWHPEMTVYPRLLTDRDGWLVVAAKIEAGNPDALRLYERVRAQADQPEQPQAPNEFHFGLVETNARTAANAALAAVVLNDPAYAEKSATILVNQIYFNYDELLISEWDYGTILGGQALVYSSIAYDLLAGFELIDDTQADAIQATLLLFAQRLYDMYITLPIGMGLQNNHLIKLVSGLGMTGMTFNRERVAAKYVNLALATAPYLLLDFQMPEGGGQGEGPNYLDYTFSTFLYFATAYHRYAQGRDLPYKNICRVRLWPPCRPDVLPVPDPVTDPRLELLLDWRFNLVMPDGGRPPIDDSNLGCGDYGVLAAMFARSDYAWLYRSSPRCAENTYDKALLELPLLDGMPAPKAPDFEPSVFMPDGGQAILRSGWDPKALYGLLVGESGKARLTGLGHEQPDNTSFMLYALGEYFAIDSGYGHYSERMRVAGPEHHNLILVDGQGPPFGLYYLFVDVEATLSEFTDADRFHSARVQATYRGVEVDRRLLLIDNDYFVTADVVHSTETHEYTWLLHANAGGTTDGQFIETPTGAVIERPRSKMHVLLAAKPDGLLLSSAENEHGFGGSIQTHNQMEGLLTATDARFLGLYIVGPPAGDLPFVYRQPAGELLVYMIDDAGYRDTVIFNPGGDFTFAAPGGMGQIESDAEVVWLRAAPDSFALVDSAYLSGSYLNYQEP